jgi:hypothetical protein
MTKRFLFLCSICVLLQLTSCTGRADHMRAMLEQAEWMNRNDSLFTSDSIVQSVKLAKKLLFSFARR